MSSVQSPPSGKPDTGDPFAPLRDRRYLGLLGLAAIIGAPISAAAWGFLELVTLLQRVVFSDLPKWVGFHSPPLWWPLPPLALSGILVAATIRYLPGTGGEPPAEGFKPGGFPPPSYLPGIFLAAFATLCLGAVLGPEAPLIALGGGLGVCAIRLTKRDAPPTATIVVASAGSFASIATLFGSPLLAAFLLMEAAGLGGPALGVVLVPGLLAAGIGSLIFIGLGSWTGLGTFSLVIPNLPHFGTPDAAELCWALVIGVAAAFVGIGIRRFALFLKPRVEPRMLWLTPVVGIAVAGLAIAYAQGTGRSFSQVLFSGQTTLGPLISKSATWSLGAVLLLLLCKGLAYGLSLSSFRGGPIFPAMFVGAAGGIAMSHLPGLPVIPAAAMGIGAMSVVMLRLPLTSVLLATLLLASDGVATMPLVIVAVAVAYVISARLTPAPAGDESAAESAAAANRPGAAGVQEEGSADAVRTGAPTQT